MRLLLDSGDDVTFEVMEVQDVSYESGVTFGLTFEDFDSVWWIIPGINKDTCQEIILDLFKTGLADLTMFPEYECLDERPDD